MLLCLTPVTRGIPISTVEDIIVNMYFPGLLFWIRNISMTYQPDPRPISVVDNIIKYFYIINSSCWFEVPRSFFNKNARAACSPVVKRVNFIVMGFYMVRVPCSKTAISPACYTVIPGLHFLIFILGKKAIVTELVYFIVVKLNFLQ